MGECEGDAWRWTKRAEWYACAWKHILSAENSDVLFCLSEVKDACFSGVCEEEAPPYLPETVIIVPGALCAVSGY